MKVNILVKQKTSISYATRSDINFKSEKSKGFQNHIPSHSDTLNKCIRIVYCDCQATSYLTDLGPRVPHCICWLILQLHALVNFST